MSDTPKASSRYEKYAGLPTKPPPALRRYSTRLILEACLSELDRSVHPFTVRPHIEPMPRHPALHHRPIAVPSYAERPCDPKSQPTLRGCGTGNHSTVNLNASRCGPSVNVPGPVLKPGLQSMEQEEPPFHHTVEPQPSPLLQDPDITDTLRDFLTRENKTHSPCGQHEDPLESYFINTESSDSDLHPSPRSNLPPSIKEVANDRQQNNCSLTSSPTCIRKKQTHSTSGYNPKGPQPPSKTGNPVGQLSSNLEPANIAFAAAFTTSPCDTITTQKEQSLHHAKLCRRKRSSGECSKRVSQSQGQEKRRRTSELSLDSNSAANEARLAHLATARTKERLRRSTRYAENVQPSPSRETTSGSRQNFYGRWRTPLAEIRKYSGYKRNTSGKGKPKQAQCTAETKKEKNDVQPDLEITSTLRRAPSSFSSATLSLIKNGAGTDVNIAIKQKISRQTERELAWKISFQTEENPLLLAQLSKDNSNLRTGKSTPNSSHSAQDETVVEPVHDSLTYISGVGEPQPETISIAGAPDITPGAPSASSPGITTSTQQAKQGKTAAETSFRGSAIRKPPPVSLVIPAEIDLERRQNDKQFMYAEPEVPSMEQNRMDHDICDSPISQNHHRLSVPTSPQSVSGSYSDSEAWRAENNPVPRLRSLVDTAIQTACDMTKTIAHTLFG